MSSCSSPLSPSPLSLRHAPGGRRHPRRRQPRHPSLLINPRVLSRTLEPLAPSNVAFPFVFLLLQAHQAPPALPLLGATASVRPPTPVRDDHIERCATTASTTWKDQIDLGHHVSTTRSPFHHSGRLVLVSISATMRLLRHSRPLHNLQGARHRRPSVCPGLYAARFWLAVTWRVVREYFRTPTHAHDFSPSTPLVKPSTATAVPPQPASLACRCRRRLQASQCLRH